MLYLTCTTITSVDLAHYGVYCAKDWVSVDCGTILKYLRGVVVEWLERLDYGAESRRKVVNSRLGFAMRQLENSLCQPSSKWVPFSN